VTNAQVGIPFVMTNAMKAALRERGLTDDAITEMTPAEAHRVLGNGAAPASNTIAEITVYKKTGGALSKRFYLVDGRLANDGSACRMVEGEARRVQIDLNHIATLATLIHGFGQA
jgi:hypothetical protein